MGVQNHITGDKKVLRLLLMLVGSPLKLDWCLVVCCITLQQDVYTHTHTQMCINTQAHTAFFTEKWTSKMHTHILKNHWVSCFQVSSNYTHMIYPFLFSVSRCVHTSTNRNTISYSCMETLQPDVSPWTNMCPHTIVHVDR